MGLHQVGPTSAGSGEGLSTEHVHPEDHPHPVPDYRLSAHDKQLGALITTESHDYLQRAELPPGTMPGELAYHIVHDQAMLDGTELADAIVEQPNIDDAISQYEASMFPRAGKLAAGSNEALRGFFASAVPGKPRFHPDHEQEHRTYEANAAEYRRRQAEENHA